MNLPVYHKIDNVFERDVKGSKKLIEGKFRNKAVEMGGNYQTRGTVEDIARMFGIDCVPIVLRGTIADTVAFVKTHPNSTFGTAKM